MTLDSARIALLEDAMRLSKEAAADAISAGKQMRDALAASLDAAVALIPAGVSWSIGYTGISSYAYVGNGRRIEATTAAEALRRAVAELG